MGAHDTVQCAGPRGLLGGVVTMHIFGDMFKSLVGGIIIMTGPKEVPLLIQVLLWRGIGP